MSIRILWSGPVSGGVHVGVISEKFEIQGTPEALAGLGRAMTALEKNTMVKAQGGYGEPFPIDLHGLKLIVAPGDSPMHFVHDAKALRIEADAARFKILGQSLINSYAAGDLPGHVISMRATLGNSVLALSAKNLDFKSVKAQAPIEKSGWFDG